MKNRIIAAALLTGAAASYPLANVDAAQPCQYPTVNVWLTGGNLNLQQGAYQAHACPLPKGHHRLTIRRMSATRIVVGVVPTP